MAVRHKRYPEMMSIEIHDSVIDCCFFLSYESTGHRWKDCTSLSLRDVEDSFRLVINDVLSTKFIFYRVLTMVYNTRNYCVFGFCPSSDILKNTAFWKIDLFPSSGEDMEDVYSVGSFRKS
jgi:hypothetical protein